MPLRHNAFQTGKRLFAGASLSRRPIRRNVLGRTVVDSLNVTDPEYSPRDHKCEKLNHSPYEAESRPQSRE